MESTKRTPFIHPLEKKSGFIGHNFRTGENLWIHYRPLVNVTPKLVVLQGIHKYLPEILKKKIE